MKFILIQSFISFFLFFFLIDNNLYKCRALDSKFDKKFVVLAKNEGFRKGIQFMITKNMRRVLEKELGYTSSEVDLMEPQVAAVIIEKGLNRPSTGMPKSWKKKIPISRRFSTIISSILKVIKRPFEGLYRVSSPILRMVKNMLPLILISFLVYFNRSFLYNSINPVIEKTIPKILSLVNFKRQVSGNTPQVRLDLLERNRFKSFW